MSDLPNYVRGRVETRVAKRAEWERGAREAWADFEAQQRALEEKTERLKTMRLARQEAER